ncbi:MAG: ethanolamine ammonia-lyase reactivating factor EutA [Firmicutes bacterium]|nr:ethanolamine ammonia-lyase reactivating factor EutA [Bacillota bacterium]
MSEILRSVGLDVGTTSTQMIFSELAVENKASGFAVPEMEIAERRILYRSPVHFTPLLDEDHVDAPALRDIVAAEYRAAGIDRSSVDTGAIIITGETSRKENARAVLDALSDFAGEFVVATAGPDLESVLAAKGAGAVDVSARTGKTVLHMDIGGGTSNLALMRDGKIERTGCLNVGGRLLKFDEEGRVSYVSPVLNGLCDLQVGDRADPETVMPLAETLTHALEMAAGLREPTPLLERLTTREAGAFPPCREENLTISFSGGVADCIENRHPWLKFGDLGPVLGQAIRDSRLCRGDYMLGRETIRATVIGAGCHSAQLSGSTVFYQNVPFPLKNVPVAHLADLSGETIRRALKTRGSGAVLAFAGQKAPDYRAVASMAEILSESTGGTVRICLEADMAKALGQALALRLGTRAEILCIDRVRVPEGSYLDVGAPVGPALPVVVKTLVLGGDAPAGNACTGGL